MTNEQFATQQKMTIRRASDNTLLTVDMINDENWKKKLEQFCKGTDGYLSNYCQNNLK
jgi:hypothetical protein